MKDELEFLPASKRQMFLQIAIIILVSEICISELWEKSVYKHSETIEYVKN